MKKRNIWISIAIIAAAVLVFCFYMRQEGYIKIDTPGIELQLRSGWFNRAMITSGTEPVKISARTYTPKRLRISGEQDGNRWQIDSFGPWEKLARIKVKNDETTVLKLGPPFLIRPRVDQSGSRVLIGLSITGQAGEHYNAGVMKNGRRQPAPKLKIVDEAGKILASGKFEYG